MEKKVKERILAKMYVNGSITEQEYKNGNVSKEMIDMYVMGVQILKPAHNKRPNRTIIEQLRLRVKQLEKLKKNPEDNKELIKHCKKQIKKLNKLIDRYEGDENQPKIRHNELCKTQTDEIKRHLLKEGYITSFQAFSEYGITRLSAIIYDLRHKEDWDIKTTNIIKRNRYGNPVIFAKYILNERGL